MQPDGPNIHFLNLEYFFRLIYDALHGSGSAAATTTVAVGGVGLFSGIFKSFAAFLSFLSHLWLFVTVLAYLASLILIGILVYSTMRLFQVRELEKPKFATKTVQEEHTLVEHSRWNTIQELIESGQQSDWRQAIIESDIMLDEMLTDRGYADETLGEKLKGSNPSQFKTLSSAWDAHKVRNEIAHQGSSYELSESLAHRTIANYEAVFKEFGEI
jgi:hypothetical protein